MAKIIYQGNPGTLPYQFSYTPDNDQDVLIQLAGSAWSGTANVSIGLYVKIGGVQVTKTEVFSNGASTHRSLIPGNANYTFPLNVVDDQIQPVEIEIGVISSETVFDVNDSVSLIAY